MLYEKKKEAFSKQDFISPSAAYRGAPFWSWNCYMTKQMVYEQIMEFKKMGFGGFHIHVRVGLKNQYMGEEFLELVQYCDEVAKENGMLCYLYDEDRYASGTAGGEVTKTIKYRVRRLRISRKHIPEYMISYEEFAKKQSRNEKVGGCLLAKYDLLIEGDLLLDKKILKKEETGKWETWYVYEELKEESPWYNNQTYVDVMNKEAIAEFIRKTHDKYYDRLKEEFGKSIPSIFTDEPNLSGYNPVVTIGKDTEVFLSYTDMLPERYEKVAGMSFFEALPYIVWNSPEKEHPLERYYYYECCAQLFDEAYGQQIGDWCEKHGIMMTGHILSEENLQGQTVSAGEAMRHYAAYHLPGIDNLCDLREFSSAKQVASVVHQFGMEGVMSEEYGVTQWDFDFEGYKLSGDWQAALGITLRVPHLAWASMNGEAKRDYPAAIGWQSPWYQDYGMIEDYFARVNYCMTRGVPQVRAAVLHPVETMWFYMGTGAEQSRRRNELEKSFQQVTQTLLTGGVDFDYISEELWSRENTDGGQLSVGQMKYEVLFIPECIHLCKSTWEKIKKIEELTPGRVIFIGKYPEMIGNQSSAKETFAGFTQIANSPQELLKAAEPYREIEISKEDGTRADSYLYQIREEEKNRWLFVAQAWSGEKSRGEKSWTRKPFHAPENLTIRIRGEWNLKLLDAVTGELHAVKTEWENGNTVYKTPFYRTDSLLLHLEAAEVKEEIAKECPKLRLENRGYVFAKQPIAYENEEPNVCLLDTFSFAWNGGFFRERTELLKIDNLIRKEAGYPLRKEAVAQPYVISDESRPHILQLKTEIRSEKELENCTLALEDAAYCKIWFNGEEVPVIPNGYYVDASIQTISLPKLQKGVNLLEVQMQYGEKANLEWMYLLGEFGVEVRGENVFLTEKPKQLYWGDYTRQGFPFYTGNMKYILERPECKEKQVLQIPYFSGAAVRMECGEEQKRIAFLPYAEVIENDISDTLTLTLLGNRYNGFGQLHMIGDDVNWLGPDSWRTEGISWSSNYQLKPMGILSAPLFYS